MVSSSLCRGFPWRWDVETIADFSFVFLERIVEDTIVFWWALDDPSILTGWPFLVTPTHPLLNHSSVHESARPSAESRDRGSTFASVFVSIIVHMNVLLILAMTFRAFQDAETPIVLDTTFVPGEEQDELVAAELPNDVTVDQKDPVFAEAAPLTPDEMVHADQKIDLPGLKGLGGAFGLGGIGAGGGVGFFGTTARGKSFVFVVDCSGSMQGSRFKRAISELRNSISQLEPDQKFQIVFFNDQALPLVHSIHADRLIPANRMELKEVYEWIDNQSANGGTIPDDALIRALALKADVVFFLTDAEQVPRNVRNLIADSNKHGSTVHTIAFGHKGGETLMQGIAADHHGRYRFVP